MKDYWRPIDLARAAGVSAQTVRKYEAWGFLPPAERGATGYRRYRARHAQALRTARAMVAGYGWPQALGIMRSVHGGDLDSAVSAVDACHAAVHQARQETLITLAALRLAAAPPEAPIGEDRGPRRAESPLQIGAAAQQVGVRVSTVRLWEGHGLLQPRRDPASGYRLYDAVEMRQLRVVALLRKGGYGFDAIRPVLAELTTGAPDQAVSAAEQRLAELAEASRRCAAATAAFWDYVG